MSSGGLHWFSLKRLMMSWLWSIWMTCLFCLSNSADAANQIIIRRGYLKSQYASNDFFNYAASNCVEKRPVYKWCNEKNAERPSGHLLNPPWPKCSCQCKHNFETFLSKEEKCVNISYLETHKDFGSGKYKFIPQADFTKASRIQLISSTPSTSEACKRCNVHEAMYFKKDGWKDTGHGIKIKINSQTCRLSWNLPSKELVGKLLKIQLKNCNDQDLNKLFFLKSNGSYVIDVPTPPPPSSTVVATISSSMESTETPTFTSYSTPTVTPTPALKTSTHQVPEFVTTPQVSPTRTFMVSSHVCSSGDICPSSRSVAVLLPTTAIQSPTNRTLGYESSLGSSIWAIIAAVVACILVGGIVAIFAVLRRRRRDNQRARFSKDPAKVPAPDTDNPMYGHNRGDVISLPNRQSGHTQKHEDEEYDYATVDGVRSDHQKPSTPIYQSLIKDNVGSSVYDPLNKVATTPMGYSYNHLQHPQYNPPRSKSDPLYNTLEIPDDDEYLEPETQIIDNPTGVSEPVYNVLEGPDANSAPHDDDPVYNVLEDPNPNQDNDPVYNVLEGPDDDYDNAPIDDDQNIPTSGQDNVAYSSTIDFNIPHSPSSPDYDVLEGPEGALPDSTYQPLSIRVQDDVYQPLDRASQSIYQTLEPKDSSA